MVAVVVESHPFSHHINLASARLGAVALWATDEFFAPKERMLADAPAVWIDGKYDDHGKWMDGWETRRKRRPGEDKCIVRLGARGIVHGVDIDTAFFTGNYPPGARVEGADLTPEQEKQALRDPDSIAWTPLTGPLELKGAQSNFHAVTMIKPVTHLRLTIVPDGGVARFRAYGEVAPLWDEIAADQVVDLVSLKLGGRVVTASNMHYGYPDAMLAPGHAKVMGEGWETRRKREAAGASVLADPEAVMNDPDWAIVKLGHPGTIRSITLDTALYKGNFPDRAFIEGTDDIDSGVWTLVLPTTPLAASTEFHFDHQIRARGPFTHLRLSIIPDGGISRFRVHGLKAAV